LSRPTEMVTAEALELVREEVLYVGRLKQKKEEKEVDHLYINKVSARWMPKLLNAIQMQWQVESYNLFLIVTGDETMDLYHVLDHHDREQLR
jgi:hypothetical protein